jgi:hypothetical protein
MSQRDDDARRLAERREVGDAARRIELPHRGFDGDWVSQLAFLALPPVDDAAETHPARVLAQEDVRGSFAAVESLSGYVARTFPLRPQERAQMELADGVAEHLERMLGGLRRGLARVLEDLPDGE